MPAPGATCHVCTGQGLRAQCTGQCAVGESTAGRQKGQMSCSRVGWRPVKVALFGSSVFPSRCCRACHLMRMRAICMLPLRVSTSHRALLITAWLQHATAAAKAACPLSLATALPADSLLLAVLGPALQAQCSTTLGVGCCQAEWCAVCCAGCAAFPNIQSVKVLRDRATGRSKGAAFLVSSWRDEAGACAQPHTHTRS